MRKFGEFIDDDEGGDHGAQHDEPLTLENDIIHPEGQQVTAESVSAPVMAIQFSSEKLQDRAVHPHATQTPATVAPATLPNPNNQVISNVVTAQQPATPGQQHNFKPGHRPAPAPGRARARFSGHAPFNNLVREDWQRAIEDDPYAFDALVYLPIVAETPAAASSDFEQAEFTEINNNQRELTYSLPHHVVILDCPDERENFFAVDADGNQDGNVDEFMVVRVAATGIPIGSVFEWNEELMDETTVPRWWYVMKIFSYGTASVGSLYFCCPARNFEGSDGKGLIHA